MSMTWNDVSVFQWQQLTDLFTQKKEYTELDLSVKAACILTGKTEHQIDSLSIKQLGAILEDIKFIHEDIQPKPVKWLKIKKKRYRCIYDIRNLPAARYIESKHFAQDVNGNLHKIMACFVMPQKKNLFGWSDVKFDAARHGEYAQDILEAPITAVLGSVVFFYQVYRVWIKTSKDYLVKEMMSQGMSQEMAEETHLALCTILDGYIKPNWLPTLSESVWRKLMKSKQ